jgi:hypothetical protein
MKNLFQLLLSVFFLCNFFGCGQKDLFEGVQDVGKTEIPGSASFAKETGTYIVTGAGFNMWANEDAFFMTWKKVDGDFSLSADLSFVGKGVNPHRKAGIIIRESLTGPSPYADIAVHGDGLTSLQFRKVDGGTSSEVVSASKAPTSICLERKGNTFLIKSGKGNLDISDAQIEMELPKTCYVGLFVCSHEDFISETAHFMNVSFKK